MDVKRFADGETIAPDTVRKRPRIPEGGECRIVPRHTVFGDGEHIAATDKVDVDVLATAAEACKWVGPMGGERDDSRSVEKRAYSVRFHTIG